MKISDFLSPTAVSADATFSDKQRLLEALARKAGPAVNILPDRLLADLLKREQLGSTGMGGGVAIPHARYHELEKPFGMLLRLRKPIDFDAVDGNPVDIVCLLLLPDAPGRDRLGALASIARKLRDPAAVAALRGARDSAKLYRAMTAD
ncbi:MAG: PTS sugar transporter subunit IIA [Xanthobacteraceae bacterium]|nr:PTS sugar transporter subunit IIA [Xanthobacteraceae bacterium]